MILKHFILASLLSIVNAFRVTGFQRMVSVGSLSYNDNFQSHPVLARYVTKLEMSSDNSNFNTNSELFNLILRDKVPVYKKECHEYAIINDLNYTMLHPYISFDEKIENYTTQVLSSPREASPRLKPLFAVVTGMGRGKTRLLVELKKQFNSKPNVFCLAITFNSNWAEVLVDTRKKKSSIKFLYVLNVIARIISMNYHITLSDAEALIFPALKKFSSKPANLRTMIHDCVKYIIGQYRANGNNIDQFVLLVDESLKIQKKIDPERKEDVHHMLRESLLTKPMVMDDGHSVKVDLVMSG
jgi:hypothetical protein